MTMACLGFVVACVTVAVDGVRLAEEAYVVASQGSSAEDAFNPKPLLFAALAPSRRGVLESRSAVTAPGLAAPVQAAKSRMPPLAAIYDPGLEEDSSAEPGEGLNPYRFTGNLAVYQPPTRLDKGTGRQVWKGIYTDNGVETPVAVKVIPLQGRGLQSYDIAFARERAFDEAAIMSAFSGGNFLKYYGYSQTEDYIMHVMELAQGDLKTMVVQQPYGVVGLEARARIFREIAEGIANMTAKETVHRRMTVTNVLATWEDGKLRAKIADFGSACGFEEAKGCIVVAAGSKPYAPEAKFGVWGPKTDIFDAGLILYQMLFSGRFPDAVTRAKPDSDIWATYNAKFDPAIMGLRKAAMRTRRDPGNPLLAKLVEILERTLDTNVDTRISAQELVVEIRKVI